MLYENEDVQQYDPISDSVVNEVATPGDDKEIEALITRARKFKVLKMSEGWQELEKFLSAQIAEYTKMLIWERDEKRVYRIQEAIKSFENVFKHIAQTIREADLYEQERTLRNEANPRSNK